jgi:hypothetical protein
MPWDVALFEGQVKSSEATKPSKLPPCVPRPPSLREECKLMTSENDCRRSRLRRYRKARAEIMIGSGAWTTREPSNTIGARDSRSCWSSTHTLHTHTRPAPDRWQSQGSLPPPSVRHRIVGTEDCRRLSIHSTYAALSRFGVKGRAFQPVLHLAQLPNTGPANCAYGLISIIRAAGNCDVMAVTQGGFFHPSAAARCPAPAAHRCLRLRLGLGQVSTRRSG